MIDLDCIHADYPRTLRTWDHRLKANIRQEALVATYPALQEQAEFESFKKKWQYLFSYAGAGFAKGYITCHMITFTRAVSLILSEHELIQIVIQNDAPEECN